MKLVRWLGVLAKSFIDFFRDGGIMLAASISYFAMMAIVPFCLFLVTIFGYFLGGQGEFYQFLSSKLMSFFPKVTSQITEELRRLITYKGLGKFTLILYGVLSYGLFSSLESSIKVIFKVKTKRSFIISVVLSLLIVTLLIALFIISFGATSWVSMLRHMQEFFPGLKISKVTGFLIRFVIPFILMLAIITKLYLLLPKKKIRGSHALFGALLTTIFLEAAKHLFTICVLNVFSLGTIYGPLSAFVIFLLWVFYSSCIFLIGAEVVHNLEGPGRK